MGLCSSGCSGSRISGGTWGGISSGGGSTSGGRGGRGGRGGTGSDPGSDPRRREARELGGEAGRYMVVGSRSCGGRRQAAVLGVLRPFEAPRSQGWSGALACQPRDVQGRIRDHCAGRRHRSVRSTTPASVPWLPLRAARCNVWPCRPRPRRWLVSPAPAGAPSEALPGPLGIRGDASVRTFGEQAVAHGGRTFHGVHGDNTDSSLLVINSRVNGLTRKAAAPASMLLSRADLQASPVIMTTGMPAR